MIKAAAFLLLVIIIVMLMSACYFLERTANLKRLAHPQKKNLNDKKINEFLLAKHHEPIHAN